MSQIYVSYLAKFLKGDGVQEFFLGLLRDQSLFDWQKMWALAALLQADTADDAAAKVALDLLRDANKHETLRAIAAVHVGRFGDHTRRRALVSIYPSVSTFIGAAIYYSSRWWPGVERSTARASWGTHSYLHSLLTAAALSKK